MKAKIKYPEKAPGSQKGPEFLIVKSLIYVKTPNRLKRGYTLSIFEVFTEKGINILIEILLIK